MRREGVVFGVPGDPEGSVRSDANFERQMKA